MKKLLSILVVIAIFTSISCKKDKPAADDITNVSSAYKVLLLEYTADWCPPCGSNTYPAYKAVTESNPYDMCMLNIHPSDDVSDGDALGQAEMAAFYDFSGTPNGAVNQNKAFGFGSDVTANTKMLQNFIDNGKKLVAKAGIGISKVISGNTIEIKTKTVFFEALSGNYNLAVYVTENGLVSDQTTSSAPILNAKHDHIFRGSANGVWGKKVASDPSQGTVVDDVHTFILPDDVENPSNIQIVAVIWKMGATEPIDMINSNKD